MFNMSSIVVLNIVYVNGLPMLDGALLQKVEFQALSTPTKVKLNT